MLAVTAPNALAAGIVPGDFTYYKIPTDTLLYPGTSRSDFGFGRGVVAGPDANVWWADLSPNSGQYPTRLGRLTTTGVFRRPFNVGETIIEDMAHGPDGNVWYPERASGGPGGASIARVEATGRLTRFHVCPARNCGFFDITAGADGNVWYDRSFRDDPNDPHRGNGSINRITPAGKITSFPVPPKADGSDAPVINRYGGMTAGPDGNVWLSELSRRAIGRITPSGQYTEFPVPDDWGPTGIASYAGDLWIGDANQPVVRRLNTDGQLVAEYRFDLPDDGFPETTRGSLAAGPNGVYFDIPAQPIGIGRVTAAGDLTLFDSGASPGGFSIVQLARGPDDNIWFKAFKDGARQIGRLRTGG
jgi:virginiamycin B lyase